MTQSTTAQPCSRCGTELPADYAGRLCPACLLHSPPDPRGGAAWTVGPGRSFDPPSPAELEPFFPQLEVETLLGRGGMGAVYRARQKSLNRHVALKILPPEIAQRPGFTERFTREAQALARLSHPHIVTVFDFGQSGPYAYLIIEYVDGINLRHVLTDGGLAPEEALAIVPQLCDALQFAHAHGVIHRDIKPENILLDSRGQVKIADFGLAKLAKPKSADPDETGTAQVVGTLYYMAPEQIEHPEQVDHRADIYSMGVVIYEMLTGELPLGRFQPPSQRVRIDVRLDEIVLRTLEKYPERRYSSAEEVKTDVHRVERTPQSARSAAAAAESRTAAAEPHPNAPEAWPDRLERYVLAAGGGIRRTAQRVHSAAARRWNATTSGPLLRLGWPENLALAAILVQLAGAMLVANSRDEAAVVSMILAAVISLTLARLALRAAGLPPLSPARSWLIGVPLAVIYVPVVLLVVFWPTAIGFALADQFYFRPSRFGDYSASDLRSLLNMLIFASMFATMVWWMLLALMIWQFPYAMRALMPPFADNLDGSRAKWFALLFLVLSGFSVVGLTGALDGAALRSEQPTHSEGI